MRWLAFSFASQASSRSNPARMASHHFQYEHLGRGGAHGRDIQRRFPGRGGDVLRDAAETRAVISDGKIIVDGFGNVNGRQRIP